MSLRQRLTPEFQATLKLSGFHSFVLSKRGSTPVLAFVRDEVKRTEKTQWGFLPWFNGISPQSLDTSSRLPPWSPLADSQVRGSECKKGLLTACSSLKALFVTWAFGLLLSASGTLLLSSEAPPEFSVRGHHLKSGVGGSLPHTPPQGKIYEHCRNCGAKQNQAALQVMARVKTLPIHKFQTDVCHHPRLPTSPNILAN